MSIILKGIDLPEKGETLILKIKDSRIYREYPSRYKFQPTRYKEAKAIQIPKGHGRLIDMDKWVYGERGIKIPVLLEAEE